MFTSFHCFSSQIQQPTSSTLLAWKLWPYQVPREFPSTVIFIMLTGHHSDLESLFQFLVVIPSVASSAILDVVTEGRALIAASESGAAIESWLNATGLILVSLPDPYWLVLHERLVDTIRKLESPWVHSYSPLRLFDFKAVQESYLYSDYANLLAITHATWHHLGTGHIHHILL